MAQSETERLLELADRCRRQAAASLTEGLAELLYAMAKDYEIRAEALRSVEDPD